MKSLHGQQSSKNRARLLYLVTTGKASWWFPFRTVEEAIKAAGLP